MSGELRRLAAAMHEAPLNKIFTDHKGRESLGPHSMAWAKASSQWAEVRRAMVKAANDVCPTCGLPHPKINPYCFCPPKKEQAR